MGLKFQSATDLSVYANGIRDTQTLGFTFELQGAIPQGLAADGFMCYSQERDRIYCAILKTTPGSNDGMAYIDPLLIAQSFPNAFAIEELTNQIFVGQLDPILGTQPHYHRRTFPAVLKALNSSTLAVGAAQFPTPDEAGGLTFDQATGVGAGAAGHWSTTAGSRRLLIFQGLTDGIAGETNLTGANVYPAGLAMMTCDLGTQSVANDADNACIWIDLALGRNVGICPWPGRATSTIAVNTEGPIAGDSFRWLPTQYIPDDDATLALPKGEILMIPSAGGDIEDAATNTAHIYARFIDFNPFNVTESVGAPARVHGRISLTSRVNAEYNPAFGLGGAPDCEANDYELIYHPPTRRFVTMLRLRNIAVTGGTLRSFIGFFTRAVDPVIVTNPAPRSVPRTNDITTFETFVGGDIGEPVSGQEVTFTLERVTTEGEVIAAVDRTFPGTSTVANLPIDANVAGDPEGTLVVYADGTPLVEGGGNDYTVVLATGVITWVTDQSSPGVTLLTVDYEHRDTPATPPNGTLITGTVISDSNGIAQTQVQWPDSAAIVGEIDKLSSAAS